MMAQEGERWIVTLIGYLGEQAPGEEAGFLEYALSLATPDIYGIIARVLRHWRGVRRWGLVWPVSSVVSRSFYML